MTLTPDNTTTLVSQQIVQLRNGYQRAPMCSDYLSSKHSDPFNREPVDLSDWAPVIKIPLAFYGVSASPEQRTIEELAQLFAYSFKLTEDLKTTIWLLQDLGLASHSNLIAAVDALPQAIYDVPHSIEIPVCLFHTLTDHPYYVFKSFQADPSLYSDYDLIYLLSFSPEYWSYLVDRATHHTSQEKTILARDPFWVFKSALTTTHKITPEEVIESLHKDQATSYRAFAYHLLYPEKPVDLTLIGRNPALAITYALMHPESRTNPALADDVAKSPMWIYNWLALTYAKPTKQMVDTLMACAPWGIQYLHTLKPKGAKTMFKRIIKENKNPYWDAWLVKYAQTQRDQKRLANP
jgi:uncharacterized UPF0146 family protein